jgi:hypothetical protein
MEAEVAHHGLAIQESLPCGILSTAAAHLTLGGLHGVLDLQNPARESLPSGRLSLARDGPQFLVDLPEQLP